MRSSLAIGYDSTVYVGSSDNKLYAINGKTGVKLWEFDAGSTAVSLPAIGSDGTVYVGQVTKSSMPSRPTPRPSQKPVADARAKSPIPAARQNIKTLNQDFLHHLAVHIGKPVISARMMKSEAFMIQAH